MSGKAAGLLAFLLLIAGPAATEHDVPYRYTVIGYVEDGRGRPHSGVDIELVREKTGFSYLGASDATGLYVVTARLGDESLGERLRLRAGGQTMEITARFDPTDHASERGTRIDWLGGKPVERADAFATTLKRFLAD